MKYNIKDVEKYIFYVYNQNGYTQKKYSVEKSFLYSGHWACFWAIIIWILLHIILIFSDHPMSVWPSNISIVSLTPFVVVFTIKMCKSGLDNFICKSSHKKISPYISLFSTIGAVSSIIFARIFLSNSTHSTNMIILSMILTFLILMFIFVGCISYYKVYLIRKFCPYLKTRIY